MVAAVSFPKVEKQANDETKLLEAVRNIALVLNRTSDGKLNSAIDFELALAPATTTTITYDLAAETSRILIDPVNAAARADWASGTVEIGSRTSGSFVITHTPHGLPRTFRASVLS